MFEKTYLAIMKNTQIIKMMKTEEIILGFPQNALRLRRLMRSIYACSEELPNEPLEIFLRKYGKKPKEIDLFVEKMNEIIQEQGEPNTISLTRKAALKLNQLLSMDGETSTRGIRIADQSAACGTGYEYVLELSNSAHSDDITFSSQGIYIYSPSKTINRFLGALIDYDDVVAQDRHFTGLMQLGFSISNPNVKTTCPCGCSNDYVLK